MYEWNYVDVVSVAVQDFPIHLFYQHYLSKFCSLLSDEYYMS